MVHNRKSRVLIQLSNQSVLLQPSVLGGFLILAATREQVQSLGLNNSNAVLRNGFAGGFARGIVLELNVCSGPSVGAIDRLASTESCTPLILAFMGVEDLPAPRAWMQYLLTRYY